MNIDGQKLYYHTDRLEMRRLIPSLCFPIYVEVSPTTRCNSSCKFCAVDYVRKESKDLNVTNYITELYDLKSCGVKSIMFGGEGEPLLHTNINSLIHETWHVGIDVALTTNGTFLTRDFINRNLRYLSWMKISINGGDNESYNKVHGYGKNLKVFNCVLDQVEDAIFIRNVDKLKVKIGVQCILLPENCDSIENLYKKCCNIGVDYFVVKPYSHNNNSITQEYKDMDYIPYIRQMQQLRSNFEQMKTPFIFRDEAFTAVASDIKYERCLSTPYFWAYISSFGDVWACSVNMKDERFKIGNINDDSFMNIWFGEKRKNLIEIMKGYDSTQCRKACRMNKCNEFLWDLYNPDEHKNFI